MRMSAIVGLVLIGLGGFCQLQLNSAPPPQAQRGSGTTERILEQVQMLEPSLAAHFLLQLYGTVKSAVTRRQILEQALSYAEMAPPYALRYLGPPGDTLDILASEVSLPKIDRFSLQLKAFGYMLTLDRRRALRLLPSIVPQVPPNEPCTSRLSPNLTPNYIEIRRLSHQLHATPVQANDAYGEYLVQLFTRAGSSLQLTGLVELLTDEAVAPDLEEALTPTLAAAMARNGDGDPEFTAVMFYDDLPHRMAGLVSALADRGLPVSDILEGYRQYVLHNYRTHRCAHLLALERRVIRLPGHNYVDLFNGLIEEMVRRNIIRVGEVQRIEETGLEQVTKLSTEEAGLERLTTVPTGYQAGVNSPGGKEVHAAIARIAAQPEGTPERDVASIAQERSDVIQQIADYARLVIDSSGGQPRVALTEIAQMCRLMLSIVQDADVQRRVAEIYARAIASVWRPGMTTDLCYAYLHELVTRRWQAEISKTSQKELDEARWRGVRDGLDGQEPSLLRVAKLSFELDKEPSN